MNPDNVPRDPEFYHPTIHSLQMARERKIPWDYVATTLSQGEIHRAEKSGCRLFLREFDYLPFPIGVVANKNDGDVVTVEYRYVDVPAETPPKDELPKPYRW